MQTHASYSFSSVFNTISERNPIRCLKTPQQTFLLHFLEKIHFIVFSNKIMNWIVTILFYCLFILNSISRIFLTEKETNESLQPSDIVFYICGFRPEIVTRDDIFLAESIVCVICTLAIIFFVFVFVLKSRVHPVILNFFVALWFYFTPILIFVICNSFVQGYVLADESGLTGSTINSFIVHFLIISILGVGITLFSDTPRDITHPFLPSSTFHAAVFFLYLTLFSHTNGFYHSSNLGIFLVRSLAAFSISIYHLCSPFYRSRIMNSLFLFCTFSELAITILYILLAQEHLFGYVLISLASTFVLSFLVYFVIFPVITKKDKIHRIRNAYISGNYRLALQFLKKQKLDKINKYNMREIVFAAVNLKYDNVDSIVLHVSSKNIESYNDLFYIWSTINILEINHGEIPENIRDLAEKYSSELAHHIHDFWANVYLSNISSLPKIATRVCSSYLYQVLNLSFFVKMCPVLLTNGKLDQSIQTDIEVHRKKSTFMSFIKNTSFSDVYVFIVFIGIAAGQALILLGSRQQWNLVKYSRVFLELAKNFMEYEIYLFDGANNYQSLLNLSDNFQTILNRKNRSRAISAALSFEENGVSYEARITKFLQTMLNYHDGKDITNLTELSDFPKNELVDMIYTLNSTLSNLFSLFDKATSSGRQIKNKYTIGITCSSLGVYIIVVLIKIHIFKIRQKRVYKSFLLIPKSELDLYETHSIKGTYQFRRKHNFSYIKSNPATILSMLWTFIGILVQIWVLYVNVLFSYDDNKEIQIAIEGLTCVQRVPLWLISGVVFNEQRYHEFSAETLDQINQDGDLYAFTDCIPDTIYLLYGDSIYRSNVIVSKDYWIMVYERIETNIQEKSQSYNYLYGFYARRFMTYFASSIILFIFTVYFLRQFVKFRTVEANVAEHIMKKFGYENKLDDSNKLGKYNQYYLPINLIGVNKEMRIVFSTKKSKLKAGKKLRHLQLYDELERIIKNISEEQRPNEDVVKLPTMTNRTVLVAPSLKFTKDNKFEVNFLTILKVNDSPTQANEIENQYEKLFESVYPAFMKEKQLPITFTTTQNFLTILLIKLDGFHETSDLSKVYIRRKISQMVREIAKEKNFIFRIRETSSEIIIAFDQDNNAVGWKLVEIGSTIGKSIISLVNEYESMNFKATALLFKSKVHNMYVTHNRLSFLDFIGDIIYDAEEIIRFCVPSHVNYVSVIPRDMRAKFTTKYKNCVLRNGTNVDLYIVV
ncbi:hypothetical protein TRFO_17479 [Tritrichomonas foetus]|uniref:Uncharacterized protein n=1 Tax=Tritrichomonas foetus TaxID=1144522 RepID=A0A1J4KN41_9EUKA|nr:hypothetical protein TRFO_17479 [Tritrichomonas foetus]|eukprot:OHT12651.1 hypothetical protein TRFO_17479 [Tritrichomonas foetus]